MPDQDPDDIAEKIRVNLRNQPPCGVRLQFVPRDHGAPPYSIAPDHPVLATAKAALEDVYGAAPLLVRMGGTVPVCEAFKRILGLDTVFFSFSVADEDFHPPNEFFRVQRLGEGLAAWAHL